MRDPCEILMAGIGNLLRSDDGLGVHVIRELEGDRPDGVTLLDAGTAILQTLGFFERARRALVIDAIRGGQVPGTIYSFDLDDCAVQPGLTIHSMGIKEALKVISPGVRPPRITVLGVEPLDLHYGMELSPTVRAALPRVVAMAKEIAAAWLEELESERFVSPHFSTQQFTIIPMVAT